MVDPATELEKVIAQLAEKITKDRDADVFSVQGALTHTVADDFCRCVLTNKQRPNGVVFLTTLGGSGDAAYRMARRLQNGYDGGKVTVVVTNLCKSAGTLLAIGAQEILMSELAELGPLDVQIMKPDTLGERTSGLTPSQSLSTLREEAFQCFEKFFLDILEASGYAITTRTAANIAGRVTAGLYRPVYAQIDPMRLGEFQRAVQIASEYGKRLNGWSKNLKDGSLARLISGYPSHEFVIDKTEAELLFHRVFDPTTTDLQLGSMLGPASQSTGVVNAPVRYLSPTRPRQADGSRNPPPAPAAGTGTPRTGSRPSGNGSRRGGRVPADPG
jgi:hypothetical protein